MKPPLLMNSNSSIGIFDSGLGGLTVLKKIQELLPNENYGIVYSQLDDFISSIEKLLQNKVHLDKLGENGFSYVKKNHYWDSLADQLIKIFDNLIKNQNND